MATSKNKHYYQRMYSIGEPNHSGKDRALIDLLQEILNDADLSVFDTKLFISEINHFINKPKDDAHT